MREIKFRAWDSDAKLMFVPWTFEEQSDVNGLFASCKYPVMQFTGLHDKSGKEIYEGDVALVNGGRFQIVFERGEFQGKSDDEENLQMFELINGEIIGNIYENPDLLK